MTTATRERPILFNGPMVRAILDGKKTQTRRVVKSYRQLPSYFGPAGDTGDLSNWGYECEDGSYAVLARGIPVPDEWDSWSLPCPFGEPGGRLWVRETWRPSPRAREDAFVEYRAGGVKEGVQHHVARLRGMVRKGEYRQPMPWRPSVHMPRWACRLVLEVTDVRVERLQEMREADARAEGSVCIGDFAVNTWDGLHSAPLDWAANPWVWVVEFRKVD